jgi:hypothetical protein
MLEVQKLYLVLGKALFHVAVLHSPDTNAMNNACVDVFIYGVKFEKQEL